MSGYFNMNYTQPQPNVLDQAMTASGAINPQQSLLGDPTTDVSSPVAPQGQGSNWWGNTAAPLLSGAASIWQGWNGWQQTQIARDSLRENKRQFNMNWEAQRNLTNRQLHEQQQRKIAAQGGIREGQLTPDEYQMKWGIK